MKYSLHKNSLIRVNISALLLMNRICWKRFHVNSKTPSQRATQLLLVMSLGSEPWNPAPCCGGLGPQCEPGVQVWVSLLSAPARVPTNSRHQQADTLLNRLSNDSKHQPWSCPSWSWGEQRQTALATLFLSMDLWTKYLWFFQPLHWGVQEKIDTFWIIKRYNKQHNLCSINYRHIFFYCTLL